MSSSTPADFLASCIVDSSMVCREASASHCRDCQLRYELMEITAEIRRSQEMRKLLYHKLGEKRKCFEDIEDSGAMVVILHSDIPLTSKEIIGRMKLLDESHVICHGGFGTVNKLVMEDGNAFAVKRIDKGSLRSEIASKKASSISETIDLDSFMGLGDGLLAAAGRATVFVRECLILVIFSFIFARVGRFCHWLSRIHYSRIHKGKKTPAFDYKDTAYSAMEDPLRAGLLTWQLSHMLYMVGPLFKLKFTLLRLEKVRSIGFIICIAWFLFKWKDIVLERCIARNKTDAPRFIALDKVLSLLMYYIAGTCIGEVSGFALRSVLAIGGVSGIAVGLAAKEIVGNFLGGALLFITRPFVIGDRVKAQSFAGWVEDIDFLHTRLIGYDQSPVLVPNSAIMNEVIVNYSRAKCRQLAAVLLLRNEDVLRVDKITDDIVKFLTKHKKVDLEHGTNPVCYLKSMSPEGLELELLCSIREEVSSLSLRLLIFIFC
ncbi:hypothetical protein L7F22_007787 [Adiantum nelumboides]|nr:hypothetical protein [Adiantum nelumboides]